MSSRVVAVVLVRRRHRDRGHDRRLGRGRGMQLVAGEAPLSLAAIAHLGVLGRQDLATAPAGAQARNLVVFDLELLADELAQQPDRLGDLGLGDQRLVSSTARSARSASPAISPSSAMRAWRSRQSPSGLSRGQM